MTKQVSVLLVDDDSDLRRLLVPHLASHALRVLEAPRLSEASDLLVREQPSLAIVDGLLPDGDGLGWIRRLRGAGNELPIVFVSAFWRDLKSFHILTKELRVSLVAQKPIDPAALAAQVAALLGAREEAPKARADFRSLSAAYVGSLPAKLLEIQTSLQEAFTGRSVPVDARSLVHRLSGAAGSFGFPQVSTAAARLEQELDKGVSGGLDERAVRTALARLEEVMIRSAPGGSA